MAASVPAVCGLLLLAVIAVFGQTAGHDFVNFDDNLYVYENPHVSGGLTGAGTAWAITAFHAHNWHPLTWLSHMLDCQLYGLKPGGHHLTNVLLHAAAAVLLFLALRRMTGALWPSAWVAAVFAIHPLRVESVAWVAERKDVLSGLFFMLTLWCYARYAERPASWGRYLVGGGLVCPGVDGQADAGDAAAGAALAGLLAAGESAGGRRGAGSGSGRGRRSGKRPADRAPAFGLSCVRLVVEKIPLFVLAAASCVVTLAAQRDAMKSLEQLAFAWRVANAAVAYVAYLGKMLYPAGLAVLYPLPKGPPPVWEVVAAVAVLSAISAAVFVARRKCPYLLFGWLWYLGTLVPVIGLVQVGGQAMADRYTYLTQIGLYMAIAWGAAERGRLLALSAVGPLAAVSALVVAGLMVCAWQQTRHWRDSERCGPTPWLAPRKIRSPTTTWASLGRPRTGRRGHRPVPQGPGHQARLRGGPRQPRHRPGRPRTGRRGHRPLPEGLGNQARLRGGPQQSRPGLGRPRTVRRGHRPLPEGPGNQARLRGGPQQPRHRLAGCGQVEEAIDHYRKALEIKPDYAEAHYNLGRVWPAAAGADEAARTLPEGPRLGLRTEREGLGRGDSSQHQASRVSRRTRGLRRVGGASQTGPNPRPTAHQHPVCLSHPTPFNRPRITQGYLDLEMATCVLWSIRQTNGMNSVVPRRRGAI